MTLETLALAGIIVGMLSYFIACQRRLRDAGWYLLAGIVFPIPTLIALFAAPIPPEPSW